jgi:hypothetical protein
MARKQVIQYIVSCEGHKEGDKACSPDTVETFEYVTHVPVWKEVTKTIGEGDDAKDVTELVEDTNDDGTVKSRLQIFQTEACIVIRKPYMAVLDKLNTIPVAERDEDGEWGEGRRPFNIAPTRTASKSTGTASNGSGQGKAGPKRQEWNQACRTWGVTNNICKKAGSLPEEAMLKYEQFSNTTRPTWED